MSTPEIAAVKARQQASWAFGDYAAVGALLQIVSEVLCESVDLRAGSHVLDIACGSGNTALAAARRFARTVGLDYVPSLLERGRERAAAEHLPVAFVTGDAESVPFPEASFDAVLSTFGVMFAPQPGKGSSRTRACLPARRHDWAGQLDTGRVYRADLCHSQPVYPTSARTRAARAMGNRAGNSGAARQQYHQPAHDAARFHLSIPVAPGLAGVHAHLFRADGKDLRRVGRRRAGCVCGRSSRPD